MKLETENETALISSFFKDQIVEADSYWIGKERFSIKIFGEYFTFSYHP